MPRIKCGPQLDFQTPKIINGLKLSINQNIRGLNNVLTEVRVKTKSQFMGLNECIFTKHVRV